MKNTFLRLAVISLLVMIMISGTAFAAVVDDGDVIMPNYVGVSVTSVDLDINSGLANCIGRVKTSGSHTADVELSLMKKASGSSSWSSVITWGGNGSNVIFDKYQYVDSGYSYRVKLSADIYNSNGVLVDEVTEYSSTIIYIV